MQSSAKISPTATSIEMCYTSVKQCVKDAVLQLSKNAVVLTHKHNYTRCAVDIVGGYNTLCTVHWFRFIWAVKQSQSVATQVLRSNTFFKQIKSSEIHWFKIRRERNGNSNMISDGHKVIGIEDDGIVEYDAMSSCPVSEFFSMSYDSHVGDKSYTVSLHHDRKNGNFTKCFSLSHSKVSPNKSTFHGSSKTTISKDLQEAIKRFLSSHRPSSTVSGCYLLLLLLL